MTSDATADRRNLDGRDTYALRPGDENYRAYVGPPAQYDVMGATQFALLSFLGLRETHRLLDFGCGSLRAGRLLIPYLMNGHYFGIDPNRWLVEDAIAKTIGTNQVALKAPVFSYSDSFTADHLATAFDFIVAQSIFSHTGPDLIETILSSFSRTLAPGGLVVATFIRDEQMNQTGDFEGAGWIYPACVAYTPASLERMMAACGFSAVRLSWYHPRQTWYVLAKDGCALDGARTISASPGFVFK